jgi:hypothetical protein
MGYIQIFTSFTREYLCQAQVQDGEDAIQNRLDGLEIFSRPNASGWHVGCSFFAIQTGSAAERAGRYGCEYSARFRQLVNIPGPPGSFSRRALLIRGSTKRPTQTPLVQ